MAKYPRRQDLVESSVAYQMYGKRLCDLTPEEKREYYKIRKQISRKKPEIIDNEKKYRKILWQKKKRGMLNEQRN